MLRGEPQRTAQLIGTRSQEPPARLANDLLWLERRCRPSDALERAHTLGAQLTKLLTPVSQRSPLLAEPLSRGVRWL